MFKIFNKASGKCLFDGITGKEIEYKTRAIADEEIRKHFILHLDSQKSIENYVAINCDLFQHIT